MTKPYDYDGRIESDRLAACQNNSDFGTKTSLCRAVRPAAKPIPIG
jgi:hypothetical protein